jgi:hypothetical protein
MMLHTSFTDNQLLFAKRHMFHLGTMPLDTPTLVKNIRIVERRLSIPPAVARSP